MRRLFFQSAMSALFMVILVSAASFANDGPVNQGIFSGPLRIKVWKSWMKSWNVDDITPSYLFELSRGFDSAGKQDLTLRFRKNVESPDSTIQCSYLEFTGESEAKLVQDSEQCAQGKTQGNEIVFHFSNANFCYDEDKKRAVKEIHFKVAASGRVVFETTILPMYLIGKDHFYSTKTLNGYAAHAGSGSITVETAKASESWDTWNGIHVKPETSYVVKNTATAGSVMGLHRHEKNQDLSILESGEATTVLGFAKRSGKTYLSTREWPGGAEKETDEFEASGGWIERRPWLPGQLTVIVPNPGKPDEVVFHGVQAKSNIVFWTLGTEN